MTNANKIPTPIVDKNGKNTTVWKNATEIPINDRSGVTPKSAAVEPESAVDALVDSIANGDKTYTLHYVSQGESMSDEIISGYLAGSPNWEDEIYDIYGGQFMEYAEREAREAAEAAGIDWDDLEFEEQEQITAAIQEKENPDEGLATDLLRETPDQLMRFKIGSTQELMEKYLVDENGEPDLEKISNASYGHLDNSDIRTEVLTKALTDLGVDMTTEKNKEGVWHMVNEIGGGWDESTTVDLIWYGDIADASVAPKVDEDTDSTRDLNFNGKVDVLVMNKWTGGGWSSEFEVDKLSVSASNSNPVFLDSKMSANGSGDYSWERTTGGVDRRAYEANLS